MSVAAGLVLWISSMNFHCGENNLKRLEILFELFLALYTLYKQTPPVDKMDHSESDQHICLVLGVHFCLL